MFFWKTVLGIFKIALRSQSMKVSKVFNTLTLKQIFWRAKTFLKKLEYRFSVEATKIKTTPFPLKTALPMLRQIGWWLQNGPITKSGLLPVTTSFFGKICSSSRTSWKELIWFTNDSNITIRSFRQRWSLILGCFFPLSILKRVIRDPAVN